MLVCLFFFPSGSSHWSEVYLSFSFVLFSASYYCLTLLFPPFLCLCSFQCVNALFPLFLICLPVSCLLADGRCFTFTCSPLLSPLWDVSSYHDVSHNLSLKDPMPLWDLPWRLPLLPLWNPYHLSTPIQIFPLCFFSLAGFFSTLSTSHSTLNTGCCSALRRFWHSAISICKLCHYVGWAGPLLFPANSPLETAGEEEGVAGHLVDHVFPFMPQFPQADLVPVLSQQRTQLGRESKRSTDCWPVIGNNRP